MIKYFIKVWKRHPEDYFEIYKWDKPNKKLWLKTSHHPQITVERHEYADIGYANQIEEHETSNNELNFYMKWLTKKEANDIAKKRYKMIFKEQSK